MSKGRQIDRRRQKEGTHRVPFAVELETYLELIPQILVVNLMVILHLWRLHKSAE